MSVRIGWSRTDTPRPGRIGGGLHLFQFLSAKKNGRGRQIVIGYLKYRRADLEHLRENEIVLDVYVLGVLRLARDVPASLAEATIGGVRVAGWVSASPEVKRALSV